MKSTRKTILRGLSIEKGFCESVCVSTCENANYYNKSENH